MLQTRRSYACNCRRVREKSVELCLLLIDHCRDEDMKLDVLQQLQQRLLDETDARVIIMLIEPNRFKTFCIRIDSLAKCHQRQHHDAMHACVFENLTICSQKTYRCIRDVACSYGVKLLQQHADEAGQFKAVADRIEQQLMAQNRLLSKLCLRHPNLTGLAKLSAGDG